MAQAQVDLAGNTIVAAVEGVNFSMANIYSGAVTSNETSLANLMANVINYPNATCFIYNSELATDTTLKQRKDIPRHKLGRLVRALSRLAMSIPPTFPLFCKLSRE